MDDQVGKPRIAIVCPGIGLVQRGYERVMSDLFSVLRDSDQVDIHLFKGKGATNKRETVPFFLARNGFILRNIPLHKLLGGGSHRAPMHVESLTLLLGMLPALLSGRFDIIHTIDPPFARILSKLKNRLGLSFKVLHTEASDMRASDYPPVDFIHQVSPVSYDEAIAYGVPAQSMHLIPIGINSQRFSSDLTRKDLRKKYSIDDSTFVVLSVAALNRYHKRIDYLIEEFEQLEGNDLLWLDGSMDLGEADIPDLAKQSLGERCRLSHIPSQDIGELYNLADVMVLASINEAFGMVVIEALSTDTAVLVHDCPHFQWLINDQKNLVDMGQQGALEHRLNELKNNRSILEDLRHSEEIRRRFEWQYLAKEYESMYIKLADRTLEACH
ncbi:MAG: glycosyltransferase involved in cell wall biosynthesis [Candidatus Azotimanducaceae bacterium]|jgi:glycosyltransferase involved in cell wall biosynthesis